MCAKTSCQGGVVGQDPFVLAAKKRLRYHLRKRRAAVYTDRRFFRPPSGQAVEGFVEGSGVAWHISYHVMSSRYQETLLGGISRQDQIAKVLLVHDKNAKTRGKDRMKGKEL